MDFIKFFNFLIRFPDGGKAGGFRSHNINSDTEIRAQAFHAGAYKFHHFIFYISVLKYGSDNSEGNVLGTYALHRFSCEVYANHTGHFDIIGLIQKLLHQLRSALAHSHGSQSAVTGVGVGTQYHLTAACQHFSGKLVDNRLMRGYVDAAVFLCTGEAE